MSKVESNMKVGQEILFESNKPEIIVDIEYINGEKKFKTIRPKSLKELNVAFYERREYIDENIDIIFNIIHQLKKRVRYLENQLKVSLANQQEEETDEI